jgi:hypothetical protein
MWRNVSRLSSSVVDPDPYWKCGSGSGSIEIAQNLHKTWFSAFQKGFCIFEGMFFWTFTYFKYIFHLKLNFLWLQSLTRIRIWIRIGLAPWIRICIEIKWWIRIRIEANADPQPCFSGEKMDFFGSGLGFSREIRNLEIKKHRGNHSPALDLNPDISDPGWAAQLSQPGTWTPSQSRYGESTTPRIVESGCRRLCGSVIQGVAIQRKI